MDPLTKEERGEALKIIFAEAPHLSATQADNFLSTVLGIARALHRLYTHACNRPLTAYESGRIELYERQLRDHFAGVGLGLYLNSDPRGNPVGILTPKTGRYNTMGGAECGWRL